MGGACGNYDCKKQFGADTEVKKTDQWGNLAVDGRVIQKRILKR
jgi:hypothetical protein